MSATTSGVKVRSRVSTQWLALGAALVVLAGVLVAWAVGRAADRVQVVQVARAVAAGGIIGLDDLSVTGVAFDAEVQGLVPERSLEALVGRMAAVDLQAGSLLQVGMWRDTPLLNPGERSVGAILSPGRYPAGLARGDTALAAPIEGEENAGVVVRIIDTHLSTDGTLSLTLAVADAESVRLAQLAATDRLVLVGEPTGEGS